MPGDVASRSALAAITGMASGDTHWLSEAGREGTFQFSSANLSSLVSGDAQQGIYVAPNSDTTGASGAWVRKFNGAVYPEWFGAVGDGTTNDRTAIQAAIDNRVVAGGGTVGFRAETYVCNTALSWNGAPVELRGEGSGIQTSGGTILKFATGLSGAINPKNGSGGLGAGSAIRNLRVKGQGSTPVSDANADTGVVAGILLQANASHVEDVVVQGFEGNGFMILSGVGSADVTINANNCIIERLQCYDNGVDSNSCIIIKLDSSNNAQAGVYENANLGNIYVSPHFSGNGSGATAVPILIGSTSGYNRLLECYKEIHADSTLLFKTTAGGAGQNVITFHTAAGSTAAPSTFTVDDGTADTEWRVQGVTRQAKFGGEGATGTTIITDGSVRQANGAKIQFQDNPLTANWFAYNSVGKIIFENGGVPYLSIGTTGFGYGSGVGGSVTQATSKSTGVTLNKVCGQITMNAAALAANTTVSFTLSNSAIAATDVLVLNHISGGTAGSYMLNAQCGTGTAVISVRNVTSTSLSQAIVIAFSVIKSVVV